jgi:anti-anti-sigma factor
VDLSGVDGPVWSGEGMTLRWDPGPPGRLSVAGEIDLASHQPFASALDWACRTQDRPLLDLTGLLFISSAGVGSLFRQQGGLRGVVVSPSGVVTRALVFSGFNEVTPLLFAEEPSRPEPP